MIEFRVCALVPFEAEQYWDHIRESVEFLDFLCTETSDIKSIEEVSRSVEGDETVVVVRTVPRSALGVLKRLLGGAPLEFLDTHRRKTIRSPGDPLESHFFTTPPVLKSKIDIHGRLSVVPTGEDSCMQVLEGTVSVVGVIGLNSIIAKAIVEGIQKTYTALPGVFSKFKESYGPRLQAERSRAETDRAEAAERARVASARALIPRLAVPVVPALVFKGVTAVDSEGEGEDDTFHSARAGADDDHRTVSPDENENRFNRAATFLTPAAVLRSVRQAITPAGSSYKRINFDEDDDEDDERAAGADCSRLESVNLSTASTITATTASNQSQDEIFPANQREKEQGLAKRISCCFCQPTKRAAKSKARPTKL